MVNPKSGPVHGLGREGATNDVRQERLHQKLMSRSAGSAGQNDLSKGFPISYAMNGIPSHSTKVGRDNGGRALRHPYRKIYIANIGPKSTVVRRVLSVEALKLSDRIVRTLEPDSLD
jgi:hypothetical protein